MGRGILGAGIKDLGLVWYLGFCDQSRWVGWQGGGNLAVHRGMVASPCFATALPPTTLPTANTHCLHYTSTLSYF